MAGVTIGMDPVGRGGPKSARCKHLRWRYRGPVTRVDDSDTGGGLGMLNDMSPDGLRIVTERVLLVGVVRNLEIPFRTRQGGVRLCRVCATVARCHPTQVARRFDCGFRDLWMRPMDRGLFNAVFAHIDLGVLPPECAGRSCDHCNGGGRLASPSLRPGGAGVRLIEAGSSPGGGGLHLRDQPACDAPGGHPRRRSRFPRPSFPCTAHAVTTPARIRTTRSAESAIDALCEAMILVQRSPRRTWIMRVSLP